MVDMIDEIALVDNWLTAQQVRLHLRFMCEEETQSKVAKRIGCSPPFLNDVIAGRRPLSDKVLKYLQFERVVVYKQQSRRRQGVR